MPTSFMFLISEPVCGCSEPEKSRNSTSNGLPVGQAQTLPSRLQPGLAQQGVGAAQQVAVLPGAVA